MSRAIVNKALVAAPLLALILVSSTVAFGGERDLDYSEYLRWRGGAFLDSYAYDLAAEGDLIVLSEPVGITFYEIDFDETPREISRIPLSRPCISLDIAGDRLVAALKTGQWTEEVLHAYDIADPTAPRLVTKIDLDGEDAVDVVTDGRYVYVLVDHEGVRIYDIRDTASARLVARIEIDYFSNVELTLSGDLLFVEGLGTLFDVSDPTAPAAAWHPEDHSRHTVIAGNVFVQAVSNIGLRFWDVSSPTTPVWLADLDLPFGVEDMAATASTLYMVHDTNQGGVATVDLGDLADPGTLAIRGEIRFEPAKLVALTTDRVVVLTFPHTSRCRLEIVDASVLDTAPLAAHMAGNFSGFSAQGDLGVLAYYGDAVYLLDLANPDDPVELAVIQDAGNLSSPLLGDGWLAAADSGPGIRFYDIQSPSTPSLISWVSTPGRAGGLCRYGDLLAAAITDVGVVLVDISNLTTPVVRSLTPFSGYIYDLEFTASGLYVHNDDRIHHIDCSAPDAPWLSWSLSVDGHVGQILVADGVMYTAVRGPYDRFHVVRHAIGDPNELPTPIDELVLPQAFYLALLDNHLYVSGTGLWIVSLGDTMNVVGNGRRSSSWMGRAEVVGDRLYTPCSGLGLYIHHRQVGHSLELANGPVPSAAASLLSAVPNPFNPATSLQFELPAASWTRIDVLDMRGRLVTVVQERWLAAGKHAVRWDGADDRGHPVAAGVYLARLRHGDRCETKPITLVK